MTVAPGKYIFVEIQFSSAYGDFNFEGEGCVDLSDGAKGEGKRLMGNNNHTLFWFAIRMKHTWIIRWKLRYII